MAIIVMQITRRQKYRWYVNYTVSIQSKDVQIYVLVLILDDCLKINYFVFIAFSQIIAGSISVVCYTIICYTITCLISSFCHICIRLMEHCELLVNANKCKYKVIFFLQRMMYGYLYIPPPAAYTNTIHHTK